MSTSPVPDTGGFVVLPSHISPDCNGLYLTVALNTVLVPNCVPPLNAVTTSCAAVIIVAAGVTLTLSPLILMDSPLIFTGAPDIAAFIVAPDMDTVVVTKFPLIVATSGNPLKLPGVDIRDILSLSPMPK